MVKRQIQGSVFLCDTKRPAKGAVVKLVEDGSGNTITTTVDLEGRFSISYQGTGFYKLQYEYDGYFTFSKPSIEIGKEQSEILQIPEICLNQILLTKPVLLNQVFFDYNSSKLLANSFPQLDSLSRLLNENPKLVIEIEAHTDANGTEEFNLKLSQDRANMIFDYLYSKLT
jgi:outer membrane protein OmpA-like peptidoglycan-associated protein